MKFSTVKVEVPENCNVILGTAHFIKTIEDVYEALINAVPTIKCGVAFCEASGPCLIRSEGTDQKLKKLATEHALKLGCGHSFIIFLKNAFPINVLDKIKQVPEANPLEVIVAETEQGKGILGVVDGFNTKGVESEQDIAARKDFLRKIGYKL